MKPSVVAAKQRSAFLWPSPLASSPASQALPWRRGLLVGLAFLTTCVAVALAAAAALERSGAGWDRWLVTASAVALALGAQLLPALGRRLPLTWLLWLGCLVATLYGHAHFFAAASLRAGTLRAEAVSESQQMQAWRTELAAIQARPLSQVAAEQALLDGRRAQAEAAWQRCARQPANACDMSAALLASAKARSAGAAVERAEAERAARLREQLTLAAAEQDQQRQRASLSPVDRYLAQLTGLPLASLGLASSLMQSLLVELLAALLWVLATAQTRSLSERAPLPPPGATHRVAGGWLQAHHGAQPHHPTAAPVNPPAIPPATPATPPAQADLAQTSPVQARLFDDLDLVASPQRPTTPTPRSIHRPRPQRAMYLRTTLALTGLK